MGVVVGTGLPGKGRREPPVADGGQRLRMVWMDPPYGVDYAGKYATRTGRPGQSHQKLENDQLTPDECQKLFAAR